MNSRTNKLESNDTAYQATMPSPSEKRNGQQFIAQSDYLKIYTDGGYESRQDTGGWGAVFTNQTTAQLALQGYARQTSSLEMELVAAVKALEWLEQHKDMHFPKEIELYTDSKILIEGLSGKIERYRQQNWLHLSGRPVPSRALWEKLENLTQKMQIKVHWIKGHARHLGNLQADELARQARLKSHLTTF